MKLLEEIRQILVDDPPQQVESGKTWKTTQQRLLGLFEKWALEMANTVEVRNRKLTPGEAWSDGVQDTLEAFKQYIKETTK